MSWACCFGGLGVQFVGEADTVDEAGLLVQAAETAGDVDDLIFFLEGFAGCSPNCFQYVTRAYPIDTPKNTFAYVI